MESQPTISNISVNDSFWIQFKGHLISFGFKGLPNSTHLTISFDEKSPDINFHVTKNVTNPKDKPKIKIALINRKHFEEILPLLTFSVLINTVLIPLDLDTLRNNSDYQLGYIPFDKLENSEVTTLFEDKAGEVLNGMMTKHKKNRYKIEGDLVKGMESLVTSEELMTSIDNKIIEIPTEFANVYEGGIIISEEKQFGVIRIEGNWYTFNPEVKPIDFLSAFTNPELANRLILKTKEAIIAVSNANTYSEVKHLNMPIRLQQIKVETQQ